MKTAWLKPSITGRNVLSRTRRVANVWLYACPTVYVTRPIVLLNETVDAQQVSNNVLMTPCDDTEASTKWCCGSNKDCCSSDVGVETLAQTFLGMVASSTLASSSSATTFTSVSTSASSLPSSSSTEAITNPDSSPSLSGGVIAGIVIGALAGVVLIGALWFFVARRRRPASPPAQVYGVESHITDIPQSYHAYEADGKGRVSEVSFANAKGHDGRTKVHEMQ